MGDIFDHLSAPAPGRRIDMKVIRPTFFAVAGGGDRSGTYSRYIAIPGGTAGFTVSWNTDYFPNGNRVAVLMANGLFPHRIAPPDDGPPQPSPPSAAVAPLPVPPGGPTASPSVIVTGSGFYVSADGDLITNNHVIKGCEDAVVVRHGTARIVAQDAKNDLALLHLTSCPDPVTARPVTFRTAPMQLGEAVYVLGYPYSGMLDNGINFTSGTISAVAGISNDSTRFQLTAPVQPGNSGGPVLDQAGNLVGIVVARMSDMASLVGTSPVPQNVTFGIKSDIAAAFLRANGVTPATITESAALPTTRVAAAGNASTAQIVCARRGGGDD